MANFTGITVDSLAALFKRSDIEVSKFDMAIVGLNREFCMMFHTKNPNPNEIIPRYIVSIPYRYQLTNNQNELQQLIFDKMLLTNVIYAMEKLRVFEPSSNLRI